MKSFLDAVKGASSALAAIAGAALCFLMLLTIADVVLRILGRPIVGTYELVGLGGAIAIGLSLPLTSWVRGHIYVDSFVARLPRLPRVLEHLGQVEIVAPFFNAGVIVGHHHQVRRLGQFQRLFHVLVVRVEGGVVQDQVGGVPGHGRRHREDILRQV